MSVRLDGLNTLGIPARAEEVITVTDTRTLARLAPRFREEGMIVLGGGSNVVLGADIRQPVCLMRNRGIRVEERGPEVAVTAAAGESWHGLVRWSLGQGYQGLENLVLIPGSVGAAPVQNIGAYGVELDTRLDSVGALEVASGEMVRLSARECAFGYRSSRFRLEPGRFVIAEVTLLLGREGYPVETGYGELSLELERMGISRPAPVQVAEAVTRIRRRKLPDPRRVPNAGSFFRNPRVSGAELAALQRREQARGRGPLRTYPDAGGSVKLAAAELIDRCGFKTRQEGGVRVWRRQPLVLTNPGRRAAAEVLAVAEQIRSAVEEAYGVRLELEPDTFGC